MSEIQSIVSTPPRGRGGRRPGAGRPKGSLDRGNGAIRQMIVEALDRVGGVEYLVRVAESSPSTFLPLVAKVLPLQVAGDADKNPIRVIVRTSVAPGETR